MIPFEGNDLPNVMGAGAAQTLMNVYGIKVGERVLMVGAGNVGLIVSYQLLQAGVKVAAVVEAMDSIGGYFVHAAKLRRFGVPIYTKTTIKRVEGKDKVEKAVLVKLDDNFEETDEDFEIDVDAVLLSVGLQPSINLLAQAGCKVKYVPALGGYVPLRNDELETTLKNVYIAGDASGIEEASTAMIEGRISALSSFKTFRVETEKEIEEAREDLNKLRSSPFLRRWYKVFRRSSMSNYLKVGYLEKDDILVNFPKLEQCEKHPIAVSECVQEIPCNPCVSACAVKAISMDGINGIPMIDYEKCTGCGMCVSVCLGLHYS